MPALTAINSVGIRRPLLFLAPIILACSIPAYLQEPAPPTGNYLRLAQEFLVSMYPDLIGKGYTVSLEANFGFDVPLVENSGFYLYIGRGPKNQPIGYLGGYEGKKLPPKDLQPGLKYATQLLISNFAFNQKRLISFGAKGPAIGDPEKYEQVSELVLNHPEVTDAEAAAILKKAGARYGPADKNEFEKNLPIARLQRFLGPLKVTSVEFPHLNEDGVRPRWPEWRVAATTRNANGGEFIYEMWFEPFKGDLVHLSVIPSATHSAQQ